MSIRAPDLPGLTSLTLPQGAGVAQGGIAGLGDVRGVGASTASAAFDGEAVLAADVWEGGASRTLPQSSPSAYAHGPDLIANVERDVNYILAALP